MSRFRPFFSQTIRNAKTHMPPPRMPKVPTIPALNPKAGFDWMKFAKEFGQSWLEDEITDGKGPRTGPGSLGEFAYVCMKGIFQKLGPNEKESAKGSLLANGISSQGAQEISEGKSPSNIQDKAQFARFVSENFGVLEPVMQASGIEAGAAGSIAVGDVYFAAISKTKMMD